MALKYVKRGYHVLCTHALTLLLLPVAVTTTVSLMEFAKFEAAQGVLWHCMCRALQSWATGQKTDAAAVPA